MSIGKKIKYLRKQLNLTQTEMAAKLLMDQSSYSRYESGRANPGMHIIKRVSDTFNMPVNWLMEIGKINDKSSNDFAEDIIKFLFEHQKKLNELLNKIGG